MHPSSDRALISLCCPNWRSVSESILFRAPRFTWEPRITRDALGMKKILPLVVVCDYLYYTFKVAAVSFSHCSRASSRCLGCGGTSRSSTCSRLACRRTARTRGSLCTSSTRTTGDCKSSTPDHVTRASTNARYPSIRLGSTQFDLSLSVSYISIFSINKPFVCCSLLDSSQRSGYLAVCHECCELLINHTQWNRTIDGIQFSQMALSKFCVGHQQLTLSVT